MLNFNMARFEVNEAVAGEICIDLIAGIVGPTGLPVTIMSIAGGSAMRKS
jgi:hypothetical protein